MSYNYSGRPPPFYADDLPSPRPYSPPPIMPRPKRPRNQIHTDVLCRPTAQPNFATFSSRGTHAIACFRNCIARVWDVEPDSRTFLRCQRVLRHPEPVFRAAVDDDGTCAVTTAGDGVARIWDLSNEQKEPIEIVSHFRSTRSCHISSEAKFVLASFYSGKKLPLSMFRGLVVLYDMDAADYLFRISVHGVPDKVKVSRGAHTIAVGCYGVKPAKHMATDSRITLHDRQGNELGSFDNCFPTNENCSAWDLSDDGHVLAICAENRQVIQVYTDRGAGGWRDAPRELYTNADISHEICRVVDNGSMIATVSQDNDTLERSILVFRQRSGGVLFSLSCGLTDRRGCLDLEPWVSYAAPTYDRPGKKVVRHISKTTGDINTLQLVTCGDSPGNSFRPTATDSSSTHPYSSYDKQDSPEDKQSQVRPEYDARATNKWNTSSKSTDLKKRDWASARDPYNPERTTCVHTDNNKTFGTISDNLKLKTSLDPLRNSAELSPVGRVAQNKRKVVSSEPDMPKKNNQLPSKAAPGHFKHTSETPMSIKSKSESKAPEVTNKIEKPSNNVLLPEAVPAATDATHAPAKKPLSKPAPTPLTNLCTSSNTESTSIQEGMKDLQANAPDAAKEHRDLQNPCKMATAPPGNESKATDSSGNQLSTTKSIVMEVPNKANTSSVQITKPEEQNGTIGQSESLASNSKQTNNCTQEQKRVVYDAKRKPLVSILKKPRWQPGRQKSSKEKFEEAVLPLRGRNYTPDSTGQKGVRGGDVYLSRESIYAKQLAPRHKDIGQKKGSASIPPQQSSHDHNGNLAGSKYQVSSHQPKGDNINSSGSEESALLDGQDDGTSLHKENNSSAGRSELAMELKIPEGGDGGSEFYDQIITVSNIVSSTYDERPPKSQNDDRKIVDDGTTNDSKPNSSANHLEINKDLSSCERDQDKAGDNMPRFREKQEGTEYSSYAKSSATAPKSPDFVQEDNGKGASFETKVDQQEGLSKNRYFEALETAKNSFHEAFGSSDLEVLSNVKAFKTMLGALGAEKDLIDRRIVAKIVYEKGGINNTLDENQFLEAFGRLYDEMQAVRRRQWAEVYNQAAVEEGEGLLVFHARDLIKQECGILKMCLNSVWSDDSLDELIASQTADGVLVDEDAFVRSTDKIFTI